VNDSPAAPGVVVYLGHACGWRGAKTPLDVDSPDHLDTEGRISRLRWACRGGFPDADHDPWWLPDQLADDHEDDPVGLARAVHDLVHEIGLISQPTTGKGWRWGPEGLWHDGPPYTLATWRWFAARLLVELTRRRAEAAADAVAAERRRAALADYERHRAVEPVSGSALTRAERQFVIGYFLLVSPDVTMRIAATRTERAAREAVGQCGYTGAGWAWDTIRQRAVGVEVTETPDGHAGVIPWREVLDQALTMAGVAASQETLF